MEKTNMVVDFYHYSFRSIIVGNSGVGKSSIIRTLVNKPFSTLHDLTIGVEFEQKMLEVPDKNGNIKNINLQIWDTAGLEQFQAITHVYFKNCCIVFIVYDVSNRKSFVSVPDWIKMVKQKCKSHVQIMLVANKIDARYIEIHKEEGMRCASTYGVYFFEASAAHGTNVHVLFRRACESVLCHSLDGVKPSKENGIQQGNIIENRETVMVSNRDSLTDMAKCCVVQ